MEKIPYKGRVGISVGLFLYSIGCIIATIVLYQQTLWLWIVILGPILAVASFVLFIVIMPKTNEDGSPIVVEKTKRVKQPKPKKQRKPFISEREWNDLDEEDEECMFVEDD